MKFSDFEPALKPDKSDLDGENIRQPELMFHVGRELARANAAVAIGDAHYKKLFATLDRRIRESWTEKDGKLTEVAISRQLAEDDELEEAKAELISLQETAAIWGALVEAFKQRSYAVKELGELYRANYFTTESGGKERSDAKDRLASEVRQRGGLERRTRGS